MWPCNTWQESGARVSGTPSSPGRWKPRPGETRSSSRGVIMWWSLVMMIVIMIVTPGSDVKWTPSGWWSLTRPGSQVELDFNFTRESRAWCSLHTRLLFLAPAAAGNFVRDGKLVFIHIKIVCMFVFSCFDSRMFIAAAQGQKFNWL